MDASISSGVKAVVVGDAVCRSSDVLSRRPRADTCATTAAATTPPATQKTQNAHSGRKRITLGGETKRRSEIAVVTIASA